MTSSRVRLLGCLRLIGALVSGRAGAYADIVGPPQQVWPGPGVSQSPPGPLFDYYCKLPDRSDVSDYCSRLVVWAEKWTWMIFSTRTGSRRFLACRTATQSASTSVDMTTCRVQYVNLAIVARSSGSGRRSSVGQPSWLPRAGLVEGAPLVARPRDPFPFLYLCVRTPPTWRAETCG